MKKLGAAIFVPFFVLIVVHYSTPAKHDVDHIVKIYDYKDFKKYLRTHTNVLVVLSKTAKDFNTYETFNEVAGEVKGIASIVHIDCSIDKKFCKKLKANPLSIQYKHFKDGEFHKSYDRKLVTKSIVKFLQNPTGDIPWDEEPGATDVVHMEKKMDLFKMITKEKKPLLVMLYAPWCGFCKKLKPDFAAAATALKEKAVLVGMDVDTVEGAPLRVEFNITGFPTLIYFRNGKKEMLYGGENTKDGIIKWMNDPHPPKEVEAEKDWSDIESEVVHLTDDTFDEVVKGSPSALVMFYAPWCGHCKKMKPEYQEAAEIMKEQNIPGILAAVDATKQTKLASRFSIKGYPTAKYFQRGEELYENHDRTKDSIVAFMKDPNEPPPPPPEDLPWTEVQSSVVHLDEESFKNVLKKKKHALVIFYAPWCGHCKKAKPGFMAAAEEFKDDTKVAFAAVDCTVGNKLCQSNEVTGYPTLKYFNYGKNEQNIMYLGGREKKDFVNFMSDPKEYSSPQRAHWQDVPGHEVVTILKTDTFDAFVQQNEKVLVTFYGASCPHCQSMKKDFVDAALALKEEMNDVKFAAVDVVEDKTLSNRFGIMGLPAIKLFSYGEEHFEYEGRRTKEDFIDLIKNPPPLVTPFTDFQSEDIIYVSSDHQLKELLSLKERVLFFFYDASSSRSIEIQPEFWNAAENVPDKKFQLAVVDCQAHYGLCKEYSVKSNSIVKLFVDGKFDSNFDFTEPVTKESLISFLTKQAKKGKIEL